MENFDSSFNALFLPGMPDSQKEYLILKEISKAKGKVNRLNYRGTYAKKHQGEFSLKNCVEDIEIAINSLEDQQKPYIVVAYSFSTAILSMINSIQLKYCEGILLFSPIESLRFRSSGGDFESLLINLKERGAISKSQGWKNHKNQFPASSWENFFKITEKNNIPVFMFVAENDETKIEVPKARYGEYARFINIKSANHKIDSYANTVAKWYLWAIISKIKLKQSLKRDITCYLWGSTLDQNSWSKHSDVDLLAIFDPQPEDYETISKTIGQIDEESGMHIGMSINKPSDLERSHYIRRNRGAVFLHELRLLAVPLSGAINLPNVSGDSLALDALNTNRIIRAEVSKQLLGYHKDSSNAKKIIKSYIQAVRISQYTFGKNLATLDGVLEKNDARAKNLKKYLAIKRSGFKDVSFTQLFNAYSDLEKLVEEQEKYCDDLHN